MHAFIVFEFLTIFLCPGTDYFHVSKFKFVDTFVKPFNPTLHRFYKSDFMVWQTGCYNNPREPAATADIGNRLEPFTIGRRLNERYDGGRIQNMTFPDNIDISGTDDAAFLAFFGEFIFKSLHPRENIAKQILQ